MTTLKISEDLAAYNNRSLRTLARAIRYSQGEFSLVLVRCNHPVLTMQIIQRLEQIYLIKPYQLIIPKFANKLHTIIQKALGKEQPIALIVLGLESVLNLNDLLTSTQAREQFRQSFPFPLVLWLNDEVLGKLQRLAPDFHNWLIPPIQFALPTEELVNLYL